MSLLTLLLFWVAAAICVVAQLALVRSGLRARPPGITPGRAARLKEVVWAILPAIVLAAVLVATWRTISVRGPAMPAHSISAAP